MEFEENPFDVIVEKTKYTIIFWRVVVNLVAVLLCLSLSIVFFIIERVVEDDDYVHVEIYALQAYSFIPASLLLLLLIVFAFNLFFDLSVYFRIYTISDLRNWYVADLVKMLEYHILQTEDPLRAELGMKNDADNLEDYEERFTFVEDTRVGRTTSGKPKKVFSPNLMQETQ